MGSADAGTDSGTAGGPPCDALTKVFAPKCAASCHNGAAFPPDMSTEKALASLVGMAQGTKCAADATSSIVNPNAPLSGSLFLWISGATCKDQMPLLATPLTADDIACVKSYFTAKIK
jgi:hypothetical protein